VARRNSSWSWGPGSVGRSLGRHREDAQPSGGRNVGGLAGGDRGVRRLSWRQLRTASGGGFSVAVIGYAGVDRRNTAVADHTMGTRPRAVHTNTYVTVSPCQAP
ncbi:unnamed protein product, partial [Ectocarpus sp. 12 AP-2014]